MVSTLHIAMAGLQLILIAHAANPGPTLWPANGTVDVGRQSIQQRMHATSRDRLASETSEEREARLQQVHD